jgi:hypothetical protein
VFSIGIKEHSCFQPEDQGAQKSRIIGSQIGFFVGKGVDKEIMSGKN